MTSGPAELCFWGLLALASTTAGASDLDSLLQSLARQPPQTVAFVEIRRSPLLTEDRVVSGVLEFRGAEQLSRIVTEPYRERIDIDGSGVTIAREGRPVRRFALRRSVELGSLLPAISALLTGDRRALEASFETSVNFRPDGWRLELEPRQAASRERIEIIRVHGAGGEPSCIEVLQDAMTAAVIRLGATAAAARSVDDCDVPRDEE